MFVQLYTSNSTEVSQFRFALLIYPPAIYFFKKEKSIKIRTPHPARKAINAVVDRG